MSCLSRLRRASYSSGETGPRAIRSLGSALPRLPPRLGGFRSGSTSPSPSIGSSNVSASLLAFLAGRPGRRPLDGRAPPTRSASLSSAFLARVLAAALSVAAAGLAAFLAAVLVAVLETFTAALAGAFSAAMLTARLAALTGVSAASFAGEVLPDVLVIVASVVVATRDWESLHRKARLRAPKRRNRADAGKTGKRAEAACAALAAARALPGPTGAPSGLKAQGRAGIANSLERGPGRCGGCRACDRLCQLEGPGPKLLAIDTAPYLQRCQPDLRRTAQLATIM